MKGLSVRFSNVMRRAWRGERLGGLHKAVVAGAAVSVRGHFLTEQTVLNALHTLVLSPGRKGNGQTRRVTMGTLTLNALAIIFAERKLAAVGHC
jgi:hypothetical protein